MSEQNQQTTFLGKIAVYTEILVKDPSSTIFVSLAETYRKLGMYDDGRQILLRGLERHPDFGPAHIVMARILCQLEDYKGSAESFKKSLDLEPDSLAALVGIARVKILLGEEDEARDYLLRARHLSPADPVINKLLLSLPVPEPGSDEAIAEEEAETKKGPLISTTLADLYLKQGLRADALDMYRKLSAASPDDLVLRRKIKELESDSDVLEPVADEAVEPVIMEEPVAEESAIDSCVTLADSEQDSEGLNRDQEGSDVLSKLNHLLNNIQRRREHV